MPKIEKIISATEFEQGTIYTDTGGFADSSSRLRSINTISLDYYKKVSIEAQDSSGNPLAFTLIGYNSEGEFDSSGSSVSKNWKDSGTVVDLSTCTSIVSMRIVLKGNGNITPEELGYCKLTLENNWVMENSYPYLETLSEPVDVLTKPCPYLVMNIEENSYPSYPFLKLLEVPTEPYPYSIMTQKKNEYPKFNNFKPIDVGAFANATNLRYIRIPESVKKIGEYAFRNTALTSVTIARDCEYYPTSFPDGCVVSFY